MKNIIVKILLCSLLFSSICALLPSFTMAWEQGASGTHEEINRQALTQFFRVYGNSGKFEKGPIDKTKYFWGSGVSGASMWEKGHMVHGATYTFEEWVIHGGFSADEPNLWASVRHFYDPLSVNGGPQLTDHNWVHGNLYDAISAKSWAFEDAANPFNWKKGLEYYKKAMEIPEGSQITVVPGSDFRNPELPVESLDKARRTYLGKAFRALGETMHMLADLSQPAHVRNDSHPTGDIDPVEDAIKSDSARLMRDKPVDSRIDSEISSASTVIDMYERISRFTNKNFYTDDTIYDEASGVKPRNWENPYPRPQFSDLTLDQLSPVKTYSGTFNGKPVPMIQQTYTSYKLGKLWTDYHVPPSFALGQAEVLIPIAVKAGSKAINSFFPTMELTMKVGDPVAAEAGNQNYKEFKVTTDMKHLAGKDTEWSNAGLEIKYSGPAELWLERKEKASRIADLKFEGGTLKKPLVVFAGEPTGKANTIEVDKYQVENNDFIYIVINAGGRIFKSDKSKIIVDPKITIEPATLDGELDTQYTFTAKVSFPASGSKYEWAVDGKQVQNGAGTSVKTQFSSDGNHTVTVIGNDSSGKEFGRAAATITIKAKQQAQPPPAGAGGSASGTFPAKAFNGMQITYSVSGASITSSQDTEGFTVSRTMKGTLGSGQLSVSGAGRMGGGYYADLVVRVTAGGETKDFKANIKTGWPNYNEQTFNVTVPIPKNATGGSFSIDMTGSYNAGTRGLIVSGTFAGSGGPATPATTGDKSGTTSKETPSVSQNPITDIIQKLLDQMKNIFKQ